MKVMLGIHTLISMGDHSRPGGTVNLPVEIVSMAELEGNGAHKKAERTLKAHDAVERDPTLPLRTVGWVTVYRDWPGLN